MDFNTYFPRDLEKTLQPWLDKKEGILLSGARQVGKSTLLKHLSSRFPHQRTISFDDRETFLQFQSNPQGLLEQMTHQFNPIFIDEFQKIPPITLAIKYLFDHQNSPPKFFLSGSISDSLISGGDSMAGRVVRFPLYSLSFAEFLQARKTNHTTSAVFKLDTNPTPLLEKSAILSAELATYLANGGYPASIQFSPNQFPQFFQSLESAFFEKDLLGKLREGQIGNLQKLTVILAKRVGFPLSLNALAGEIGIDTKTVKRLLNILQFSYWIKIVTPKANFGSEFKNKFKAYFLDIGLTNFLAGDVHLSQSGPALENFVFGTLIRQLDYRHPGSNLSFWHTYDGGEVDFIAEIGQKILAFEVKNQTIVRPTIPLSLVNFIKKYHPTKTFVINKNFLGQTSVGKVPVIFLPAHQFGLLSL